MLSCNHRCSGKAISITHSECVAVALDTQHAQGMRGVIFSCSLSGCRLRLKCDDTGAETRFCLSAKRTSPFKSAGVSVHSTTGSGGVRISGSDAGYTKFRGNEGYWLPTPFASFPFTSLPCVTVCHQVSDALYDARSYDHKIFLL